MNRSKINVFLVDDHQVLLNGLKLLLEDSPRIRIAGTAENGKDLMEQLGEFQKEEINVDVILMDITMPIIDGLQATRHVKALFPQVKVIMLTMRDSDEDVRKSKSAGADAFLSKDSDGKTILNTIRTVHHGASFTAPNSPDENDFKSISRDDSEPVREIFLTDRERKIICLVVRKFTSDDIAGQLSLSPLTLTLLCRNIRAKFGVSSDKGLIREALRRRICDATQVP